MTDQTQTPPVDKWLISEPGGPAGPFWGIVTQSGRVIADETYFINAVMEAILLKSRDE